MTAAAPGSADVAATDPLIWESFLWGLISALSLNIGSAIGVTCLPERKLRAILMSFGGGALLFALSIELFAHVLHEAEADGDNLNVWVMCATSVLGGLLFASLNRILNASGGDMRKEWATRRRFQQVRKSLQRQLSSTALAAGQWKRSLSQISLISPKGTGFNARPWDKKTSTAVHPVIEEESVEGEQAVVQELEEWALAAGLPPSSANEACACGSMFMPDAEFCRKCGLQRPPLPDRSEECNLQAVDDDRRTTTLAADAAVQHGDDDLEILSDVAQPAPLRVARSEPEPPKVPRNQVWIETNLARAPPQNGAQVQSSALVAVDDFDDDFEDERKASKISSSRSKGRCSSSSAESFMIDERRPSKISLHGVDLEHNDGQGHAALMVWLGILIDSLPESVIIGILINQANGSIKRVLPFVVGVFLSNFPESMTASGMMKMNGFSVSLIMMMWFGITVITAIGAAVGAVLFPPGSDDIPSTARIVAAVEGLAGGAMLTMIAQTMMPEAFEQGGDVVGLACLAGFLSALMVRLIL